jgi:hypothetical protein
MKTTLIILLLISISISILGQKDGFPTEIKDVNAPQDQVLQDDLIIQGNLGIGFDMTDGYDFDGNSLVLRENNLRILFNDTSSPTFADNDWNIQLNDSYEGGLNYFKIIDLATSNSPFTILDGNDGIGLSISGSGRIGINERYPDTKLGISSSDSPSLMLSAGDKYMVAKANEANFTFTNNLASATIFKINSNTQNDLLYLASNGNVGINTNNPEHKLEVSGAAEVSGYLYFGDKDIDNSWRMKGNDYDELIFEKRVNGEWIERMKME